MIFNIEISSQAKNHNPLIVKEQFKKMIIVQDVSNFSTVLQMEIYQSPKNVIALMRFAEEVFICKATNCGVKSEAYAFYGVIRNAGIKIFIKDEITSPPFLKDLKGSNGSLNMEPTGNGYYDEVLISIANILVGKKNTKFIINTFHSLI